MVTRFGAFYDSTLDRVGDGATFIGIGAFLLTAPDVAYRVPAVIACMVAILSSLLVSYARARAEGLGLDCKVGHRPAGRADPGTGGGLAGGRRRAQRPGARGAGGAARRGVDHHGDPALRLRAITPRTESKSTRPAADSSARRRSILSRKDVSSGSNRRPGGSRRRRGSSVCCASASARWRRPSSRAWRTCAAAAPGRSARSPRWAPSGSASAPRAGRPSSATSCRSPRSTTWSSGPGIRCRTTPTPPRSRRACSTGTSTSSRSATSSRRSSRCRRSSTSTTSSGSRARTSRPERPSASWPRRCARTSATSRRKHGCSRLVMVWCASTEIFISPGPAHWTLDAFERAMDADDPSIAPSMLYAWAALMEGVPFANGAPNLTCDFPAMEQLAKDRGVAIGGKDFKTGQTMVKTVLVADVQGADARRRRLVLDQHPGQPGRRGARRSRELQDQGRVQARRAGVHPPAEALSRALRQPLPQGADQLLSAPRATTRRAGTTSTSSGGWATRCRSRSISSAATRSSPRRWCSTWRSSSTWRSGPGSSGIQEWLSFYFKSPQVAPGLYPEHDLFIQQTKLKNTLRYLMGEEQITHLGIEYYQDD